MTDTSISGKAQTMAQMQDFAHIREDRIRFADLDFQQHVGNAALTAILAGARFDFLGEHVRPKLEAGSKLVIVKLEAEFHSEVAYGPAVMTGTRILQVGSRSMRLTQAIFQDGRCMVSANSVFVYVSDQNGVSTSLPDSVRSLSAEGPSSSTDQTGA